ncbi:GNAT family N-acetyltransferase [Streptomyces sp. NPDC001939]
MADAWVVMAGADVVGHMVLTPPGLALAAAAGPPLRRLPAGARLFAGTRARRRGVAALLLDRAIGTAAERGQTPVLEVETAACAAIGLYERAGRRHVGTSTADRTTADGRLARTRKYVAPAPPMNSSNSTSCLTLHQAMTQRQDRPFGHLRPDHRRTRLRPRSGPEAAATDKP